MSLDQSPLLPADLDSFLSVREVAHLLHLSPRTVRRWVRSGRLEAVRTSMVKGRIVIPRASLKRFLETARTVSSSR